jgi:hypothetical protein
MPRFVILEHDHPVRHWDLLLEAGDVLRAWRLAAPPIVGQAVAAEASFDHRRLYLDYEGPISGGRGTVSRWDAGTFDWIAEEEGRLALKLQGDRVGGVAVLERLDSGGWSLRLEGWE